MSLQRAGQIVENGVDRQRRVEGAGQFLFRGHPQQRRVNVSGEPVDDG
jgi:hypothetical protein